MLADILIRKGHVIDPACGIDEIKDIIISGNKIVLVENTEIEAEQEVDAYGCYVLPGLIDFHTHIFHSGTENGVIPELMCATGVTSVVDAGSSGCLNYKAFRHSVISNRAIRIKCFLSCCSIGLGGGIFQENFDPTYFDTKKITELKEQFPNDILGLKIRIPRELVSDLEPLKRAIKIASDIGDMSVCVHVTNAPASMDEVAKLLRAGDIFCHVFHGRGPTILDDKGQVLEGVRDARNRGVIFDMSHGKTNFSNDVCLRAMEMGFSPDVISTDMGTNRFFKGLRVRSLPFVMSKMISFGMPLYDVVNCVSAVPAKLMKMEGMIGTLAPEARADVTIMKIEPTEAVFEDFEGKKRALDKLIVPVMTILDGQVVFAREGFSLS